LLLLAITIVGVVYFWQRIYAQKAMPAAEPGIVAGNVLAPFKPDQSIEFEGVTDRKPIGLRDTAAYMKLLARARDTGAAEIAREARRDVLFQHLWEHPRENRGVPVHLLGTAFRIIQEPSSKTRSGRLYTATIVTPDSSPNPYCCVFEDAPANLPLGDKLSERVVFNGYFLKLLAYEAHDGGRGTPLIIGKLGWVPEAAAPDDPNRPLRWMMIAIGAMFVVSFFRWITRFRRSLQVKRAPSLLRDRPTEEISPEDLSSYLGSVDREDENAPSEEDSQF